MVLYTAADLIWATRIKAAADDLALPARPVRTAAMLTDRLVDSQPSGLLVDLEADAALQIIALASEARRRDGRPRRIVAFGPHADRAALDAARAAGADDVLTRGAVSARLGTLLAALEHA